MAGRIADNTNFYADSFIITQFLCWYACQFFKVNGKYRAKTIELWYNLKDFVICIFRICNNLHCLSFCEIMCRFVSTTGKSLTKCVISPIRSCCVTFKVFDHLRLIYGLFLYYFLFHGNFAFQLLLTDFGSNHSLTFFLCFYNTLFRYGCNCFFRRWPFDFFLCVFHFQRQFFANI